MSGLSSCMYYAKIHNQRTVVKTGGKSLLHAKQWKLDNEGADIIVKVFLFPHDHERLEVLEYYNTEILVPLSKVLFQNSTLSQTEKEIDTHHVLMSMFGSKKVRLPSEERWILQSFERWDRDQMIKYCVKVITHYSKKLEMSFTIFQSSYP